MDATPQTDQADSRTHLEDGRPITFDVFDTRNEAMRKCLQLARAASQTSASILIIGEAGTGKSTLAEAIHNASPRTSKPFLSVSCASVPTVLIESELFGTESAPEKGIERGRRGKFERAHGGTLVLEEIGALPPATQEKILGVLEHGHLRRVGGERDIKVDVRIIALASRNLLELVAEKQFREDLYYRLNEISLALPPLRERREDIRALSDQMIEEANTKFDTNIRGVSRIGLDYLMRHEFPGNLEELRNVIERSVTVAKGDLLWLEDLGMRVEVPLAQEAGEDPEEAFSLASMEKRHIQHVLDYTKGNKKRTSELLKISRPTLDRKIKIYNLRVP